MDRVFESGAAGSPPSAPAAPSSGYPTNGDPQVPVPATKPGDYWFYMVTEELRKVIADAALVPDHTDVAQLSQAIQQLIANAAPTITDERVFTSGVTFAPAVGDGDAVYWDSGNNRYDQAVADGTSKQNSVGFADVTNDEVTFHGLLPGDLAGLTPGSRYYLHGSTPGAITTVAPDNPVIVGVAKSATDLFVDIEINQDNIYFNLAGDGGYYENINTVAASGSTETLPTTHNVHDVTLTANCTFTFAAPTAGKAYSMSLRLKQDATGGRATIWPVGVTWFTPDGASPALKTDPLAEAMVEFIYLGGWIGFLAGEK